MSFASALASALCASGSRCSSSAAAALNHGTAASLTSTIASTARAAATVAISFGCGGPMRSNEKPAFFSIHGTRSSLLREHSVMHTPCTHTQQVFVPAAARTRVLHALATNAACAGAREYTAPQEVGG